ncbi:MAG: hypothetical protein ACI9S8_003128, partial [Chlamydiales bacterium]
KKPKRGSQWLLRHSKKIFKTPPFSREKREIF